VTTINGNITGGSGNSSAAISNGGTLTINGGNIVNTSTAMAISGKTPTYNPNADNYIQFGTTRFYYDLPTVASVQYATAFAGNFGILWIDR
jgi:hypothetical protein